MPASTSNIVGLDRQPVDADEAPPQQGSLLPPPATDERVKVAGGRPKAPASEHLARKNQKAIQFDSGPFPMGERRWSVLHDWTDEVAEGHKLSPAEAFLLHTLAIGAAASGEARMGRTFLLKRTRLTRRGLMKALRRLETLGIIEADESRGKRGPRASRYRFSGLENGPSQTDQSEQQRRTPAPSRGELSASLSKEARKKRDAESEAAFRASLQRYGGDEALREYEGLVARGRGNRPATPTEADSPRKTGR